MGVTNASGPGIPQPNFVSRNEQRDITALGRSLVIFSFGNIAYGFFIQFAECLPWRAGSCFRADALLAKAASLVLEYRSGSFFKTVLISGRTVFCIDIGNITLIHMVKLHLPHMYMIFVDNFKENNNPNLLYNT